MTVLIIYRSDRRSRCYRSLSLYNLNIGYIFMRPLNYKYTDLYGTVHVVILSTNCTWVNKTLVYNQHQSQTKSDFWKKTLNEELNFSLRIWKWSFLDWSLLDMLVPRRGLKFANKIVEYFVQSKMHKVLVHFWTTWFQGLISQKVLTTLIWCISRLNSGNRNRYN